jgi:hypothetical protein
MVCHLRRWFQDSKVVILFLSSTAQIGIASFQARFIYRVSPERYLSQADSHTRRHKCLTECSLVRVQILSADSSLDRTIPARRLTVDVSLQAYGDFVDAYAGLSIMGIFVFRSRFLVGERRHEPGPHSRLPQTSMGPIVF